MRPLIGISQCLDDRGRWRPGRSYQYLDCAYAGAVSAAGATAVHVPVQSDTDAILDRVDGVLVPGGGDFLPGTEYPETVRFDPAPAALRDFDERLIEGARERELPLLAVCYGMQLLALSRGGSILYDIPTDRPTASDHRLPEADGRHALRVEAGTRLAAVLGPAPGPVNSLHHQAVDEPGAGLRVAARAEDGIVEAVEDPEHGFCVGVQWHPEKMEGLHRDRLFAAFVAACRERDAGLYRRYK